MRFVATIWGTVCRFLRGVKGCLDAIDRYGDGWISEHKGSRGAIVAFIMAVLTFISRASDIIGIVAVIAVYKQGISPLYAVKVLGMVLIVYVVLYAILLKTRGAIRSGAIIIVIFGGLYLSVIGVGVAVGQPTGQKMKNTDYGHKIWSLDLLAGQGLDAKLYSNKSTGHQSGEDGERITKIKKRSIVRLGADSTLEATKKIAIPAQNLGTAVLSLGIRARAVDVKATVYILMVGADPRIVDSFYLKPTTGKEYIVDGMNGKNVTVLLTFSTKKDEGAKLRIDQLSLYSAPPVGKAIIKAVQEWDGALLNGYSDDFWFQVYKVGPEPLLVRTVKMAKNGYTRLDGLSKGTYLTKGMFHSIPLGALTMDLSGVSGYFGEFRVAPSLPVDVRVLFSDGTTGIPAADVTVTSNTSLNDIIRGGFESKYRRLTDKNGNVRFWLFPSMSSKHYYIVRAYSNGKEIGKGTIQLPKEPRSSTNSVVIISALPVATN